MTGITIEHALNRKKIRRVVSATVPERWRRASLTLTGADDESTYSFFIEKPESLRVELVQSFFQRACPWSPFLVHFIPKGSAWRKLAGAARRGVAPWRRDPTQGTRLVSHDTRVDHAAQLVLLDVLRDGFTAGTPTNVIGFVPGVDPFDRLVDIVALIQAEPRSYRFARAFDLEAAFDLLDWSILDRAIDRHLGEGVGGAPRVDAALRNALKGLARVTTVHRDGTSIPRAQGIPQGAVLSPFLLNIYLRKLDHRVIRRVHDLGCRYYRYADDMLLVGPSIEAIEKASGILRAEVERARLRLKEGTGKTCDLVNRQNPVEWLGIEFTHTSLKVPRSRIEKKAGDLLLRLRRGQLGLHGLDASLDQLREHYARLVGDDEADKAEGAIRKLLTPFLNSIPEEKGGIEHIVRQTPSWRTGRSTRSRAHSTGYPCREGDPPRGTPSRSTWTPTGSSSTTERQGPHDGEGPSGPSSSDTPHGRDLSAPTTASGERSSPGSNRGTITSSSTSSLPSMRGLPLAADPRGQRISDRPRPEPSPQPQVRGRMGKVKSTPEGAPLPVALVRVRPGGRGGGRVLVTFSDDVTLVTIPVDATAHSHAELVTEGYRLALMRLVEFDGIIQFRVSNPVIAGHVFKKNAIRSPFILRRWIGLVRVLDDRVHFILADGSTCAVKDAGRHRRRTTFGASVAAVQEKVSLPETAAPRLARTR